MCDLIVLYPDHCFSVYFTVISGLLQGIPIERQKLMILSIAKMMSRLSGMANEMLPSTYSHNTASLPAPPISNQITEENQNSSGNSNSFDLRVETVRNIRHGARAPKSPTKYPSLIPVSQHF